jgi:hypothetical protein
VANTFGATGALRPQTGGVRECGTCALCCKVVAVDALGKTAGAWCGHAVPRRGCGIYTTRPEECRTFNCTWLIDPRLGEHWKPERSKFVLIAAPDGNGIEVRCDPGFATAWRKEPFYAQIMSWSRDAVQFEGIVVVYVGNSATLITPEREFSLGEVGARDRIAREMEAGRVVRAYVVKGSEASAMPAGN